MGIFATIFATIFSSAVATLVTFKINQKDKQQRLQDQLDSILKIAIEYPYLENPSFANTWNNNKDSESNEYLRYENYCTLVFNYLERLCKFHNYDSRKIEQHLNVKDWIRIHKQCWENPSLPFENADGYNEEFKSLMKKYLN